MLLTLIQKEMMHHILSVRFVALLVMWYSARAAYLAHQLPQLPTKPGQLSGSYRTLSAAEINDALHWLRDPPAPDTEFSKLFLEPTPLSVFAKGLEESLPGYLGMTRTRC